jgi:hypothetical protein
VRAHEVLERDHEHGWLDAEVRRELRPDPRRPRQPGVARIRAKLNALLTSTSREMSVPRRRSSSSRARCASMVVLTARARSSARGSKAALAPTAGGDRCVHVRMLCHPLPEAAPYGAICPQA